VTEKPHENYHLLPFGRPLTPEQIYEDILLAVSQDTGISVEGLKAGRKELTEEELVAWRQRVFGGGNERR
jgi:hypothetical protein